MKTDGKKDYLNGLVRIRGKNGDPYITLEKELGPAVSEYRKK